MPKIRKLYTDAERAAILDDMQANGLTQVAAAKKHGVSAITIWQWKRAAKGTRRSPAAQAKQTSRSNGSLEELLRTEVRDHIQQILPQVVREEVARTFATRSR